MASGPEFAGMIKVFTGNIYSAEDHHHCGQ